MRLKAIGVALLGLVGLAGQASGQSYPSQQIRLIVPFAAGGVTDLLARMAGDHIRAKTVATIAEAPQVLVVNTGKVPAATLQEFIAFAKSNPTKLNYGSAGTGTPNHLGADQIMRQAGITVAHVPYRGGGPAVADLVAGNVEVAVVATGLVIEHVNAGTLKVLAAVAPERLPFLPDVPTTAEGGLPTYDTANWLGIVAPARTPPAVVAELNHEITSMADEKAILDRIERAYMLPFRVTPEQFAAMVQTDNPKWIRS